jgi:hypothetical protein
MGHVYGDSTPFPFDINFIEVIRHAVDACCTLMASQHEIVTAVDRTGSFDQLRKAERSRLDAMSDAIKLTMTAFTSSKSERMVRTASRILETARGVIESEMSELESAANGQISSTRATVDQARERSFRAIETFLLRHDVPGTSSSLRMLAGEEVYSGQALVQTPFGVEAVFALSLPTAHEWGRVRRVAELSPGTDVHVPMESGWLSKRVEVQQVKLDKLFITEIAISAERTLITLRKQPRLGPGYQVEFATDEKPLKAQLAKLGEDGQPTSDPVLELSGEDGVHVHRLWSRVTETTKDLSMRRQGMSSATFDGKPMREMDEPQQMAQRLINVLAPVVQEIAKRSGAPGELVLRRDLGEGRREEIYITKAELHEKVLSLPSQMRPVFDSFELSEGPRSPRAPAASEPIFLDAEEDDVEEEDEETTTAGNRERT